MNAASANAFLKTLEEPPGDALIILITAMPQSLLPTIRSRCQEIRFQPLPRHTLRGPHAKAGALGRGCLVPCGARAGEHGPRPRDGRGAGKGGAGRGPGALVRAGADGPGETLAQAETLCKGPRAARTPARDRRSSGFATPWSIGRPATSGCWSTQAPGAATGSGENAVPLPRMLADMELFIASGACLTAA